MELVHDLKLTYEETARIAEAVRAAEKRTSGEIVPMVVPASDPYPHADLLGGVIALFLTLALWLWLAASWRPGAMGFTLLLAFIAGLLAAHLLPDVKRFLLGRKVPAEEVHQRALQAFFEHGLVETRDRTGILIFVSLLERRVEVIADAGIHKKVGPSTWDSVVSLVLDGVRRGALVDGLCAAIARCGDILAEHFPPRPDDVDELPDEPIVEK
jgi:putative membrane protein